MDNIILILIIILAMIICSCLTSSIQNKKENFNNIRHGGYFIKGQKELENNIKQLPNRGGISMKEKMELKKIVNMVLKKINNDLKQNFHIVEFEHVVNKDYGYGIKRHIIDVFVHEVHNFYNRRIIIDLFINTNKRLFEVNSITLGNANKDLSKDKKLLKQQFDEKIITKDKLTNAGT